MPPTIELDWQALWPLLEEARAVRAILAGSNGWTLGPEHFGFDLTHPLHLYSLMMAWPIIDSACGDFGWSPEPIASTAIVAEAIGRFAGIKATHLANLYPYIPAEVADGSLTRQPHEPGLKDADEFRYGLASPMMQAAYRHYKPYPYHVAERDRFQALVSDRGGMPGKVFCQTLGWAIISTICLIATEVCQFDGAGDRLDGVSCVMMTSYVATLRSAAELIDPHTRRLYLWEADSI